MASFPAATLPTDAELSKLLSLIPVSQQPAPPLADGLAELLAACRVPAALDFLINPEADPLSVLTSPLNRRAAVASTVVISSLEPHLSNDFSTSNPLDTFFTGNYAFIPAFSIADTQLGFGVRECQSQIGGVPVEHPCSPVSRPGVFRFLRNDSAHVLILVQDLGEPLVKIDYFRLLSGCMRRRHFLVVTRSGLLALHRAHSTFEPSQLAPHVILHRCSTERRACPMCGNQPDSPPCFCVINVPKSRHALDFSVMGPAMSAHLGSYEGFAVVNFALRGIHLRSATISNRMTISERVDQDLIDRLSRCVIDDELSKSPENPLKDLLLRSSQLPMIPANDQSTSNTDRTDSSSSSVRSLSVSDSTTPVPLVLSHTQASDLFRAICEPHTRTSSVLSDPMRDKSAQPCASTELDVPPSKGSQILHPAFGISPSSFVPSGSESNEPWISSEFRSAVQGSDANPITVQELDDAPPAPMDEDLSLTDLIADQAMNGFATEDSAEPGNCVPQPEPVAIAPAAQLPISTNSKPKTQEERERRAELRRQRNREAAQRSNLKRKIKNDTLKADLKKWHGKVTELRRIEVGLREENLKLRKLLSEG